MNIVTTPDALPAEATQRISRLLRHEVGDLLQSIYAIVSILHERLPQDLSMEHKLLADLKARGETCRYQLDAVVDLVHPLQLDMTTVELSQVVPAILNDFRRRSTRPEVKYHGEDKVSVRTDARQLSNSLMMLLRAVCRGARSRVDVFLTPNPPRLELRRDGAPLPADQLTWIDTPFATTQQAFLGLALSTVGRLLDATGGILDAENPPDGGILIRLTFAASQS